MSTFSKDIYVGVTMDVNVCELMFELEVENSTHLKNQKRMEENCIKSIKL